MSNLKLKKTDWASLAKLAKNGQTRVLGFKTTVENVGGNFIIRHHDNTIALVGADGSLTVTNAGWGSSTTRNRLNHILRDNGKPFGVTQRDWEQILVQHGTGQEWKGFRQADFDINGTLVGVATA